MRSAMIVLGLAATVLSAAITIPPATAQTPAPTQGGATATMRSPVPAIPPPVSVSGNTAAQSPTNPPELVAPPAGVGAPPVSAPLTGSTKGSLAGSDQINPSVGGGNRP